MENKQNLARHAGERVPATETQKKQSENATFEKEGNFFCANCRNPKDHSEDFCENCKDEKLGYFLGFEAIHCPIFEGDMQEKQKKKIVEECIEYEEAWISHLKDFDRLYFKMSTTEDIALLDEAKEKMKEAIARATENYEKRKLREVTA